MLLLFRSSFSLCIFLKSWQRILVGIAKNTQLHCAIRDGVYQAPHSETYTYDIPKNVHKYKVWLKRSFQTLQVYIFPFSLFHDVYRKSIQMFRRNFFKFLCLFITFIYFGCCFFDTFHRYVGRKFVQQPVAVDIYYLQTAWIDVGTMWYLNAIVASCMLIWYSQLHFV